MNRFYPSSPHGRTYRKYKSNGNVLFLILIAVALFAALSYAVTSSTRGSGNNTSKEKANIFASEISQFATAYRVAVQRLQLNGCSDAELDFYTPEHVDENGNPSGAVNPSAPADGHCSLFHPKGGGVAPVKISKEAFNGKPQAVSWALASMYKVGTIAEDYVLIVGPLDKEMCAALNNAMGVTNPSNSPPVLNNTSVGGELSLSSQTDGELFFCGYYGAREYVAGVVVVSR